MTTLSINFYADNMTDELKNEFTQAIAHESADMNIQLLNDSIAKLEKKIVKLRRYDASRQKEKVWKWWISNI